MKLNTTPRVGIQDPNLQRELREHAVQVNAVSEGRIGGSYNAQTAAPTTGQYAQGDFVRNSAPVEAGVATSRYVVLGWICTVGGSPGTFLPVRALTGN
jgi:hypothetical protein